MSIVLFVSSAVRERHDQRGADRRRQAGHWASAPPAGPGSGDQDVTVTHGCVTVMAVVARLRTLLRRVTFWVLFWSRVWLWHVRPPVGMIENGFSINRDTRFCLYAVAVEGGRRGGGWKRKIPDGLTLWSYTSETSWLGSVYVNPTDDHFADVVRSISCSLSLHVNWNKPNGNQTLKVTSNQPFSTFCFLYILI